MPHLSPKPPFENMNEVLAWQPEHPYNRLPLLPPLVELETRRVLKQCITARAALAELKQAAQLIPHQTMLVNTLCQRI